MIERGPASTSQHEDDLEERLSRPDDATRDALRNIDGDVLILGAGGKMGPTLARMARRALDDTGQAARGRRVIAVSRFSNTAAAARLEGFGIEIVRADLSDPRAYAKLPAARNAVWMVGQKFGTTGDPVGTWTQNVAAAAFGAEFCAGARVVCFSSGNVYPRSPRTGAGSTENDALRPDGEYAASCIGRERMFESASRRLGFPLVLYRLFYACDLRYGVVTDIALRILRGEPVSLATPGANIIWQGDANRLALRALGIAASPAIALNVTGPIVSVREIAQRLANAMEKGVEFVDSDDDPNTQTLLADTTQLRERLPFDGMTLDELCVQAARWILGGHPVLGKPTKFDARDGKF
ncbi:MAG: NAD(P)-dependent oxidoreductase [Phycisphaerae bacterium]|nr:NAD(P)-dependent oxidoreductase [Gemmatimonadaceae bacterium]